MVKSARDWKKSILLKPAKYPHFPASFENSETLLENFIHSLYLCSLKIKEFGKCEIFPKEKKMTRTHTTILSFIISGGKETVKCSDCEERILRTWMNR